MIKHPGARTRALYRWEDQLLQRGASGGNRKVRSEKEARFIIDRIWKMEGRKGAQPAFKIKTMTGMPYYETERHEIVLTNEDHFMLTLIHEIVHSLGLGHGKDIHDVRFIKKYAKLLAFQYGWTEEQLLCEAKMMRLL